MVNYLQIMPRGVEVTCLYLSVNFKSNSLTENETKKKKKPKENGKFCMSNFSYILILNKIASTKASFKSNAQL